MCVCVCVSPQAGQQGLWLITEEALLELSKQQGCAALADVTVCYLQSKEETYQLFGEVAKTEGQKARQEEVRH